MSLLISIAMLGLNILMTLFRKESNPLKINGLYIVFISIFLVFLFMSYLLNGLHEPKAFNHLIAYNTVVILFFLNLVFALKNSGIDPIKALQTITIMTTMAAFYTVFEGIAVNFMGIDVNLYIPRPSVNYYNPLALGVIIRARGFAVESGHHALMMEIFVPLALYYLWRISKMFWPFKLLITIILAANIIITYSTASFVSIPTALGLVLIINWAKTIKGLGKTFYQPKRLIILVLVVFSLYYVEKRIAVFDSVYLSILSKMGTYSQVDRNKKMDAIIHTYQNSSADHILFGYGPSGFRVAGLNDAVISWYPTILFEAGLIGLFILILHLGVMFFVFMGIRNPIRPYLLFAYFCAIIHYYFIGDYWYPWIWFLMAFGIYLKVKEKYDDVQTLKFEESNIKP